MTETGKVKCQICGCEISKENGYMLGDAAFCGDCYMEETYPVQTCDPRAIRSGKVLGQTESLDDLQKALYKFVKTEGKVTFKKYAPNLIFHQ